MSSLLQEFVAEARELIEQAGQTLLDLEDNPNDISGLNTLFRHIHTIKGGAGLFEPPGLVPTLHAAEDLLDRLRENELVLTAEMTDTLLKSLDQVVTWLDMLEEDGELSVGQADVGNTLAKELASFVPEVEDTDVEATQTSTDTSVSLKWLADVPQELTNEGGHLVAIEFIPDEGCFFTGSDPLATAMTVPGRRWMEIVPRETWPENDEFDPYSCNLAFRIVSVAPKETVDEHLLYVIDDCKLQVFGEVPSVDPLTPLQVLAIDILEKQKAAIQIVGDPDIREGRMRAVGSTVISIIENCELPDRSTEIDSAVLTATDGDTSQLRCLIDDTIESIRQEKTSQGVDSEKKAPMDVGDGVSSKRRENSTVKVDQDVLDTMMKLVGEMIVAKNALPFLVKRAEDVYQSRRLALEIRSEYESINRIVEDMQASVMQMRMVPVSQVFQRYQRLVRDLSRRLDKKINLQMEGEDTKADKNIVEELADPLVHLIRNACDHGLERPDERRTAGKTESGKLVLSARQVEDQVVIAVKDDGRGINIDRVRGKAIENELMPSSEIEALSDKDAMQLILRPGFSTADQVSDLSGRGVGMDVVNTMVKRAGGTMWIDSEAGHGSEISITLPMSMAVSQVMMFEVGRTLYGIAIENIVETVRVRVTDVHRFKAVEQILLRDRLIPLVRARKMFSLPPLEEKPEDELTILVVRNGDAEIGYVVDRVRSEADVKLEAIDECLNAAGYFSGAALLGDGSIMLLINAKELF